MANVTVSADMDMESAIGLGLANGDKITVENGAVLTMTETNSVLIGNIDVPYGTLKVDGVNISSGTIISLVGQSNASGDEDLISLGGQGKLVVEGAWVSVGTTNGSNAQTINLSTYFNGGDFVDVVPMIQIETGRRINYDGDSGIAPAVGDWVVKATDKRIRGKIKEVGTGYVIVWALYGSLSDNDPIHIEKVINNQGPDMQISWTANVDHASGDIKEAGVYTEFGNARSNGIGYMSDFSNHLGGQVFEQAHGSTTLTLGTVNGTTNLGGFVPPSGCDIRLPNVHICSSNTTNFPLNDAYYIGGDEKDLYRLECSNGGEIDLKVCNIGSGFFSDSGAGKFEAEYVGAFTGFGSNVAGSMTKYTHCVLCQDPEGNETAGVKVHFAMSDNVNGGSIKHCLYVEPLVSNLSAGAETSNNVVLEDNIYTCSGSGHLSTNSTYGYIFRLCDDVTMNNNVYIGGDYSYLSAALALLTSKKVKSYGFYYSATQDGSFQNQEMDVLSISAGTDDVLLEGITQITDQGMAGNNFAQISDSSNIEIYAVGRIDDKIVFGSDGEYFANLVGLCTNVTLGRCWKEGGSVEEFINVPSTCKNIKVINSSGDYGGELQPSGADGIRFIGVHGASGDPGGTSGWENSYVSSYGNNFHYNMVSDTKGWLACIFLYPSSDTSEMAVISGNPVFYKDGSFSASLGDIVEFTPNDDFYMLGVDSFTGNYSSIDGSSPYNSDDLGNLDIYFQHRTLDGDWNGTWLDVRTPANLTGLSYTASDKIQIKFRLEATGNESNCTMVLLEFNTTIASQKQNYYPLKQLYVSVTVTVLDEVGNPLPYATVLVYLNGDVNQQVIYGKTDSAGVIKNTNYLYSQDDIVDGVVRYGDNKLYEPANFVTTITSSGANVTVKMILN